MMGRDFVKEEYDRAMKEPIAVKVIIFAALWAFLVTVFVYSFMALGEKL